MLSVKSAGKKTTQLPAGDGWGICIGLVWFGLLTRMLLSSISFVSISGCCRGYPAAGQGDPYSVVLSVSSLHSCSHRSLVSSLSLYPPRIRLAQSVPPGFSHSLTGGGWPHLLPRRRCFFPGEANGVCLSKVMDFLAEPGSSLLETIHSGKRGEDCRLQTLQRFFCLLSIFCGGT